MKRNGQAVNKLKLISPKLGEIQYENDEVITFPDGLLGFPKKQRYFLVDHKEGSPFKWLQSLDEPSLSFVVINPLLFKPDYRIGINPEDLSYLKNTQLDQISIWTIVSFVAESPERSTVNLLGPLAIDSKTRLGKQLVLDPAKYDLRCPLFPEAK